MSHEMRKVSKIIDELTTYFLLIGVKKIKTEIINGDKCFKIKFKIYDFDFKSKKITEMLENLSYNRESEMEEYYWELAGESDRDNELCLIGIMTDEVNVEEDESMMEITLYRNKY